MKLFDRNIARMSAAVLALGLIAAPTFAFQEQEKEQDKTDIKPADKKPADVKIDQSSPKATAKTFLRAVTAANGEVIAAIIHEPTKGLKKMFELVAPVMAAAADLNNAMMEKFKQGMSQGNPMGEMPTEQQIDEAKVSVEGDKATIKVASQPEPMDLIQKDGKWFIVMDADDEMDDDQLEQAKKVMPAMVGAMKDVAKDVRADKFKTAAEAEEALQSRIMQAMMKAMQEQGMGGQGQ